MYPSIGEGCRPDLTAWRAASSRTCHSRIGLPSSVTWPTIRLTPGTVYIGIELGGAIELVAFDNAFEVAKLRDDAVLIDGGRLYIRVEGSPAMN